MVGPINGHIDNTDTSQILLIMFCVVRHSKLPHLQNRIDIS